MIITGSIKCSKCNHNIEWEYIVPQKLGVEPLQAETLNDNKAHPYYCDALNSFNYYSERYL